MNGILELGLTVAVWFWILERAVVWAGTLLGP
jgi:hypothetical protein